MRISGSATTNIIKTEYTNPWINMTREFLQKFNAKIEILEITTIQPMRINDKYIMELKHTSLYNKQTTKNKLLLYLATSYTHIQNDKNQRITLITPPQCENLIRQFEEAGAEKYFKEAGLID